MAKKTISSKYREHDAALPQPRVLQSYETDASEIHYEAIETFAQQSELPTAVDAVKKLEPKVSTVSNSMPKHGEPVPVTAATKVDDEVITARDVVVGLVAQKLRKGFGTIDCSKSIKNLVGGRSTLENEIIGDLSSIFSSLPDRAEEMDILELSRTLSTGASMAKLMAACAELTAGIFSQKMPGGFTVADARWHLEEHWGLGIGRQDAVLLRTATEVLPSRLKSNKEATIFLDTITKAYGTEAGLILQPISDVPTSVAAPSLNAKLVNEQHGAGPCPVPTVNPVSLDNIASSHRDAITKAQRSLNDVRAEKDALQYQVDVLTAELGNEFIDGITPVWSPRKIRKYESCWNWALQDLLLLVHGILCGEKHLDDQTTRDTCDMIVRRSNQRLLDVMRYLKSSEALRADELLVSMVKEVLSMLIEDGQDWISHFQTSRFFSKGSQSLATPMSMHGQTIPDPNQCGINNKVGIEVKVKTQSRRIWKQNNSMTELYQSSLVSVHQHGLLLKGKTVLLTGAGPSSIGRGLLHQLLLAGARVLVTTSHFSPATCRELQALYMQWGSSGSQLVIVPFNQGSKGDCEALVKYVFDAQGGLGWDLDYVIPFAAVSEEGQVDELGSKSEFAHRIMLTNVLRLLGAIKQQKQDGPSNTSPVKVLLPLSPNHGVFGNDGLYAESKVGLEMLLNKWYSEEWSPYLAICGAVIGWVRGTGLMAGNDVVAADVEAMTGIQTFSQAEIAQYLAALLAEPFAFQVEMQPVYIDLSGGMNDTAGLHSVLSGIRRNLRQDSLIPPAQQRRQDYHHDNQSGMQKDPSSVSPLANLKLGFPKLPDYHEEISPLHTLRGMVDPDRVVVITGMSEVGPWGNARTRWEMEACGEFSLEGCIEMAWIMGFITHYNGRLNDDAGGEHYIGWVDAKSKAPVADAEVKALYERQILEHSGIRLIEPELDEGYDPSRKQLLHEIVLTSDLAPFAAQPELAKQFMNEHGDKVDVLPEASVGADWTVRLRRGATILVPKALRFDRVTAGQIPQGWDARRYGVPDWAVEQIGRETIFALVSTAEALISSGIVDPYELYQYMHVSEVGNCVGSALGGQQALKKIFRHRYHGKQVQSDILQEVFINTAAAWINMLLLSSSGPIRTPVGACATAVESLELGYELITSGRAKVVVVGGHDDMTDEVAYEFAKMRATASTDEEFGRGRMPSEMSRPMTSTRNGFVEAQGSGVQILANARTALDMGLPIHGIVSWVGTASDKTNRSVPSPGKGILTNARETSQGISKNPLLDLRFRRDQILEQQRQIQADLQHNLKSLEKQPTPPDDAANGQFERKKLYFYHKALRRSKQILRDLGHEFWVSEPDVSPIRGALSAWGLTIDDLDFVSLHGTSTTLNDKNETSVIQKQLSHLGRSMGNPVYSITQKFLTGHSKGAAGAWMLNGALQALDTGLIPGNRNADDIAPELETNDFLFFPHHSIQTNGLRACSITSFGFGQKGAQAIIVHPRYLYATLADAEEFHDYKRKLLIRQRRATRFFQKGLATQSLFVTKEKPPYTEEQESHVLLNPNARMEGQCYNV
ncbi:3-oxoacyl-synthase [Fusarium subglutinans]|uniref:beta-ketoacyl-[acyl-carrier-protein] synthase I n=1 Tax=Gibberella subglutinans TaxID=42677 RepID=A0A8H5NSY9_GIBSU|nr:3-oxoacyl-synthase [Fusarium subglutinans]KAF5574855.1 3-oxoacyl-synthase [Fusarium subglutinans]